MSERYRLVSQSWRPPGTRDRITRGTVFTPPEDQVERLLRIGAITPVGSGANPEMPAGPAGPFIDLDAADAEPSAAAAQDAPPAEPVERPKQAAAKAVWVDYAVARGMDRDQAEDLDKRELIAELS